MDFTKMPDTVYLVDLENVGSNLARLTMEKNSDVGFIVFYSDATVSPGSLLETISKDICITFIDCKTGGNNAMDFCICAVAGMLAVEGKRVVRVLSNDKGYDPMLRMLQEQGMRIKREAVTYAPAEMPKKEIIPPWRAAEAEENEQDTHMTPLEVSIQVNVPKKYRDEVMKTIPKAINRKEAHEMLQAILPQSIVADTYRKLRKHIPREVA